MTSRRKTFTVLLVPERTERAAARAYRRGQRDADRSSGVWPHPAPGVRGHYEEGLDAISDDGVVPVPDGPGLGIEYDCDFIFDNCTGSVHTYE